MADGTDLFARTLAFDHGDGERNAIMRKVWSATPWMIDCFTDRVNSPRYRAIREWCSENIGPQAHPIHGVEGDWQDGSATVHGWTWIGFKSEEMLARFMKAFPPSPTQEPRHDRS